MVDLDTVDSSLVAFIRVIAFQVASIMVAFQATLFATEGNFIQALEQVVLYLGNSSCKAIKI